MGASEAALGATQGRSRSAKSDFRLPNGRPPEFAAAYGHRLRSEGLTDGKADAVIADLERDRQANLKQLSELDTPGKVQRGRKIRAKLAERLQDIQRRVTKQTISQNIDPAVGSFEEQAQELRIQAEAAIDNLVGLDTPEKRDQERQFNAALEKSPTALRERLKLRYAQAGL